MKKPLIIFGLGEMAQLAHYYFTTDSDFEVVAFTVDSKYINNTTFYDLPVIAFEEIALHYSPDQYDLFIAIGYSKLNMVRKEKYLTAKEKGYRMASFVSSHATVLNDGCIGENSFIFEANIIQPFVTIGNNVILWSGNNIGHHSIIKDHCFIACQAVLSGGVEIGERCFIGANATLRDHIKVGEKCVIGAGALLLADAEPESVYIGAASERTGFQSTELSDI